MYFFWAIFGHFQDPLLGSFDSVGRGFATSVSLYPKHSFASPQYSCNLHANCLTYGPELLCIIVHMDDMKLIAHWHFSFAGFGVLVCKSRAFYFLDPVLRVNFNQVLFS